MPQTPMPQVHPIPPLFDAESRVLILGSFRRSSRGGHVFYGHPQNRLWPLLVLLTGGKPPQTVEERALALRHHLRCGTPLGSAPSPARPTAASATLVLNDLRHHGACADRTHFLQREHVAEILPPL